MKLDFVKDILPILEVNRPEFSDLSNDSSICF